MTLGYSVTVINSFLDAVYNNIPFSFGSVWLQLHDGDPGANGTAHVLAGSATRQQLNHNAADGGSVSLSAGTAPFPITAGGTASHISEWSAPTGGTFIRSGKLAAARILADGDNPVLDADDITYPAAGLAG
ncbi:hypothetical protein EV580_1303 [Mycobacterium sp. BK086]|uniref:phage tail fiber protein n=1 Tax=Mycobacterium sp. BK086 TaxID=2512165 RepID=UPI0010611C09|nr:hypothetical protein [Mycobacterium sp. BK086]TDO18121.1 hypothetical protein EV580_1303 [Mycobacterium sp. BK086]